MATRIREQLMDLLRRAQSMRRQACVECRHGQTKVLLTAGADGLLRRIRPDAGGRLLRSNATGPVWPVDEYGIAHCPRCGMVADCSIDKPGCGKDGREVQLGAGPAIFEDGHWRTTHVVGVDVLRMLYGDEPEAVAAGA